MAMRMPTQVVMRLALRMATPQTAYDDADADADADANNSDHRTQPCEPDEIKRNTQCINNQAITQ